MPGAGTRQTVLAPGRSAARRVMNAGSVVSSGARGGQGPQYVGDGPGLVGDVREFAQQPGAVVEDAGGVGAAGQVVGGCQHQASGAVVVGDQGEGVRGAGAGGLRESHPDAAGGEFLCESVLLLAAREDEQGVVGVHLRGAQAVGSVGTAGPGTDLACRDPLVRGLVQRLVAQGGEQPGHGRLRVDLGGHRQRVAQRSRHSVHAFERDATSGHCHAEADRHGSGGAGGPVQQQGPDGLQRAALRNAPAACPGAEPGGLVRCEPQPDAACSGADRGRTGP